MKSSVGLSVTYGCIRLKRIRLDDTVEMTWKKKKKEKKQNTNASEPLKSYRNGKHDGETVKIDRETGTRRFACCEIPLSTKRPVVVVISGLSTEHTAGIPSAGARVLYVLLMVFFSFRADTKTTYPAAIVR